MTSGVITAWALGFLGSWRHVFMVFGAAGFALGVGFIWLLKDETGTGCKVAGVLIAGSLFAGATCLAADDDGTQVLSMAKTKRGRVALDQYPVACREVAAVKDRAPSLLPDGRKFKLVWNDEFDGTELDDSKWMYRTNFWGRNAHWFAKPEDGCVEVKDGLVHLKVRKLPNGQLVSPQLQTGEIMWDVPNLENPKGFWYLGKRCKPKFAHKYGYYECRCRLQQLPGC